MNVQLTVPLPPGAGVVQVVPAGDRSDVKRRADGNALVSVAFSSAVCRLKVIVKVSGPPGLVGSGLSAAFSVSPLQDWACRTAGRTAENTTTDNPNAIHRTRGRTDRFATEHLAGAGLRGRV